MTKPLPPIKDQFSYSEEIITDDGVSYLTVNKKITIQTIPVIRHVIEFV